MAALITKIIVLLSNRPYSQVQLQSGRSAWSPMALPLHRECSYIDCPHKQKVLHQQT